METVLPTTAKIEFHINEISIKAGHLTEILGFVSDKDFLELVPHLMEDNKKYDLEIHILAHLRE